MVFSPLDSTVAILIDGSVDSYSVSMRTTSSTGSVFYLLRLSFLVEMILATHLSIASSSSSDICLRLLVFYLLRVSCLFKVSLVCFYNAMEVSMRCVLKFEYIQFNGKYPLFNQYGFMMALLESSLWCETKCLLR